jgi:hypothetical protein
MSLFAFFFAVSVSAVCGSGAPQDAESVSLLQVHAHQSGDPNLDELDDAEKKQEVTDEEEDIYECANWCYSKKHQDKAWEGHKCNWYACSTCPECVPNPSPTLNPTPHPTPAPTPPVLQNGDIVNIQNLYSGGDSYLDVCGSGAWAGGVYNVQTSSSRNRDAGSGSWKIIRENGGGVVSSGDNVYVVNQYSGGQTYLAASGTFASPCTSNTMWNACTANVKDVNKRWRLQGNGGPITFGETVTFHAANGQQGYLDSCGGATCGGGKWEVTTNRYVRGSTSQWRLIANR